MVQIEALTFGFWLPIEALFSFSGRKVASSLMFAGQRDRRHWSSVARQWSWDTVASAAHSFTGNCSLEFGGCTNLRIVSQPRPGAHFSS